jgi:hypothetical protein
MELKKENIDLSGKANVNPFRVPEGYFDLLPQQIMSRVGSEKTSGKEMFIFRHLQPYMRLAMGLIVIAIIVFFPYRIFKPEIIPTNQTVSFDEEYFFSCTMNDQNIYETLESENPETPFNNKELENVLLGSVNEYELIVLNDQL